MSKPPFPLNRRVYLLGLSAAAISTWLAGCGGGEDTPVVPSANAIGSLNTNQIGGAQLKVFTVFSGMTEVVNGSFSTKVSEDVLQTLLVSDGNQKLRAMSLHISGRPLVVDANSTALAIVFLTPGISTLDKATGTSRLLAIQSAPGFAAFLQLLQVAMLSQDLPSALATPAIRTARDLVVAQVFAEIQAQTSERPQQAVDQSQSDGYVVLKKDDTSTAAELKIQLTNEGFRFVKVVRKESFDGQNQLAVPVLKGSPANNSIISGRAGASIAAIVSRNAGAPGGATDIIDQRMRKAERLTYYVRGLGNPLHASDKPFPADVQSLMEAEGNLHLGMTVFFYFLLPVVEPILAVFTGVTPEQALSAVGKALGKGFTIGATEAGFISAATAGKAGDQAGFLLALGDLIIGLTPILLKALSGVFIQLAPGAAQIELGLTAVGAVIATVNFSIAGAAFFRTPQRANVELELGIPIHFLEQVIATDVRGKFVNLTADGSLVYNWIASSKLKINRLRIPSLGSPYPPEVSYDISQDVRLIAGNANGEMLAQVDTSSGDTFTSTRGSNVFYLYKLPDGGALSRVKIGEVTYAAPLYVVNPNTPGEDQVFEAGAINSNGDVAGTYFKFQDWFQWDVNEYRPILRSQVWWIPKGGSLVKKDANSALLAALETAYPLGSQLRGIIGERNPLTVLDLNSSGVVLIVASLWVRDNVNSRDFTEKVAASFNMVTGRVIIISRILEPGLQTTSHVRAGKINDKGQVALSRSESGIFFGEFYNGTGATGEPVPTVVGFKDRFYVNDLTEGGDVGGFEQLWDTPGVTGKAAIWKASSVLGEIVDVHAQLASTTITEPYSSSIARLGEDGTMVGTVITKRLTNPDLPAGSDNPEVDVVRDFVIQGATAN